jgi:hypothetical protein
MRYFKTLKVITSKDMRAGFIWYLKFLVSVFFFAGISQIFRPDVGLDFTDEGHYLISADAYLQSDAWTWPYGWNLRFVFEILGHSISNFRIFGIVVLMLATQWFSRNFIALVEIILDKSFEKIQKVGISTLIVSSSLFFYAGYLRTPSYNWLNLVGTIVAFTGIFRIHKFMILSRINVFVLIRNLLITSAGGFIALPAKPSTTIFLIFWVSCLVFIFMGTRAAIKTLIFQLFMQVVIVSTSVMFDFWPSTVFQQIKQSLDTPPLASPHSIEGALKDLLLSPYTVADRVNEFLGTFLWLVIPILILQFYSVRRKYYGVMKVGFFDIAIIFGMWKTLTLYKSSNSQTNWIENEAITGIILVMALGSLLDLLAINSLDSSLFNWQQFHYKVVKYKSVIYLQFTLVMGMVLFGFGTSSGLVNKLALVVVFQVPMILVFVFQNVNMSKISLLVRFISASVLVYFLLFVVISGSYFNPYRMPSISQQTTAVSIGNHNTKIYLDTRQAKIVEGLKAASRSSGFTDDTHLITLVYPSGIGYGYALGGRQSPTILFAWFGYPNSVVQANYLIDASLGRFDFANAWFLISTNGALGSEFGAFTKVLTKIQSKSNLEFPADYVSIYKTENLELWKPNI